MSTKAPPTGFSLQCCRCRKRMNKKDYVQIYSKREDATMSACPNCRCFTFYRLNPETGVRLKFGEI